MKRLLVTGASGFLGWNICQELQDEWGITGTVFSHPVLIPGMNIARIDLTDYRKLKQLFHDVLPEAVIHTAAATDPNYCQQNKSESEKINVAASVNIAGLCADRDIPCVFTSTDLVFNGKNAPYREDDPVSPINIYGEQKARAEEGILRGYPSAAVCRMPLMFGDPGPVASSFFNTMIGNMREGRELRLFIDEFRTPVSGITAARGILLALKKFKGIFHMGGRERISRYEFGVLLRDLLGISNANLLQCRQSDMKMAAPRARDVSLDSSKAMAWGYTPPPLKEELRRLLVSD